jgi:hypothetical protein
MGGFAISVVFVSLLDAKMAPVLRETLHEQDAKDSRKAMLSSRC